MVYSTLGILNFAYGELITIIGYTMYLRERGGAAVRGVAAILGIVVAGAASVADASWPSSARSVAPTS